MIPTGSISFDAALGVGGVPRGRVIEVFGPESSGKTTISLQIIAEAQKAGGMAAFVDAEHALDPAYAKRLGVAPQSKVCVRSRRGDLTATAFVTSTIQPGQVFIPMHYAATNRLTLAVFDPYSRQPAYKACAVSVQSLGRDHRG